MRQVGEEEQRYVELLKRVSDGETTKEDWELLKTRELTGDGQIPHEEQEYIWKEGRKLCARNIDTIAYNQQRIRDLDQAIAKIQSENKPNRPEQRCLKASQAKGLPPTVTLAKGSRVKLTENIFKKAGLTNGSVGTVVAIIYEEGSKPQDLPSMVIVHFPDYIGKISYKGMDGCWPIIPIERDWYNDRGKKCWRRSLPLEEAYSNTIHSCQGQSLSDPVIICLSSTKEFAEGLIFTSITRVKKFNQLSFHPTLPDYQTWFRSMRRRQKVKDRLAQEQKERESDANFDASLG